MDPEEALKRLRELSRQTNEALHTGVTDPVHLLEAWEEQFEALDQWLSNGGFAPQEWKQHG